jgi:NADPH-dependent ferric siderophore reductase
MVSPEPTQRVRRKRPPPRTVKVRQVTQITPHMVRITLGGEQMEGFETTGVAEHVRVFMPNEQTGLLLLPIPGPEGYAFPENADRPISRAYTPRRFNPQTNEIDIDFVIHGEGPASAWAASVKPGDTAVISGQPGGTYQPETHVDWYLIGGDEAGLPAIATLLEALPASIRTYVYIEVRDQSEEQELPTPSQAQITWLHRGSDNDLPGQALAIALRQAELPEGDGRIWITAEASVMRDIRKHYLEDRNVDRTKLRTQGYWKQHATNHTDHDMGDDV